MLKGVLLSLFLIVGWVAIQLLVIHLARPVRIFYALTFLFAATVPAYFVLYAVTPPNLYLLPESLARTPSKLGLLNGLLIHLLLYCSWMQFYYYVDRPVTLRILVEFVKAPAGQLSLDQMKAVYSLQNMIEQRVEMMQINGYLEVREGFYTLTRKGKALAKTIQTVRRILGVPYYFEVSSLRAT